MRSQIAAFAYFTRVRNVRILPWTILLVAVAALVVPIGTTTNPITTMRVTALEFIPAMVVSSLWTYLIPSPIREFEQGTASRMLRPLTMAWYLLGTLSYSIAGSIVWLLRHQPYVAMIHCRNVMLAMGIATLCGMLLSASASWSPGFVVISACWLWGIADLNGSPAVWAIPCYPSYSVTAWLISIGVWGAVGIWYIQSWARPMARLRGRLRVAP